MGTRHWPEDADEFVEQLENEITQLASENESLQARVKRTEAENAELSDWINMLESTCTCSVLVEPPQALTKTDGEGE